MKGIHRSGDFGFNGVNGHIDGWFDDAVDWVKENVTGGVTTTEIAEQAAADKQKQLLTYGAIIVALVLVVYLAKKKKLL